MLPRCSVTMRVAYNGLSGKIRGVSGNFSISTRLAQLPWLQAGLALRFAQAYQQNLRTPLAKGQNDAPTVSDRWNCLLLGVSCVPGCLRGRAETGINNRLLRARFRALERICQALPRGPGSAMVRAYRPLRDFARDPSLLR